MADPNDLEVDSEVEKVYNDAVQKFVDKMKDEEILVFTPGEVEYERSVATPNLFYRYSRPHCVVQPKRASQVQMIVGKASKSDPKLKLTIKCGGHSYAGFSTAGKGISLDLSKMNKATISTDKTFITLQGGCQWAHAYKQLVNNGMRGKVINGGRCPTVGVGGFLLGGGLGPFSRSQGMGCDSLIEARIVTADGNIVTASDKVPGSEEAKLFWALRGGGGGNFGVVVELKMRIQDLSSKLVTAARFTWTPKNADEGDKDKPLNDEALKNFYQIMNKFYTTNWPETTTIDSSWLQTGSVKEDGKSQVRFLVYHDGADKGFDELINQNIEDAHVKEQLMLRTLDEASTKFLHETLVDQWSEEIVRSFPSNKTFSLFTSFVFKNDEATIHKVTPRIYEQMQEFKKRFSGEAVLMQFTWIHGGGKVIQAKKSGDTAFPWREGTYFSYIMLQWEQKHLGKKMQIFLDESRKIFREHSMEPGAAFINFADPGYKPGTYEKGYFGANYPKLQEVKDRWDKENFFDWEQGVKPSGWNPETDESIVVPLEELADLRFSQLRSDKVGSTSKSGEGGTTNVAPFSGEQKLVSLTDLPH